MRTVEEINKEYGLYCGQLGELIYKSEVIEKDIETLKHKIHNLNIEAIKLNKAQSAQRQETMPDETTSHVAMGSALAQDAVEAVQ